jgi:hypothetical protein
MLRSQLAQDPTSQSAAYLSALRQIDRIPVPDLASTLTTAASDDDDATEAALFAEPSLSYLRTNIEARDRRSDHGIPDPLSSSSPHERRTSSETLESHRQRITRLTDTWRNSMEERDARLDRLERVLAQLNRMHGSSSSEDTQHRTASTAPPWSSSVDHRAALSTRESARQADLARIQRESSERQADLLRIQRETREVMRYLRDSDGIEDQSAADHRTRLLQQQQQASRMQSLQERPLRTGSLRGASGSTAGSSPHPDRLSRQDGRRHPRFWSRHRELLARSGEYSEGGAGVDNGMQTEYNTDRAPSRSNPTGPETYGTPGTRSRNRRSGLPESTEVTSSNLMLQDTLLYLSNLRISTSRDDALSYALQAGFSYKDFASSNFVSSLDTLTRPAPTSLMAPGATFKGAQFSNSFPPEYPLVHSDSSSSSMYQLPNPLHTVRSNSGQMFGLPPVNATSTSSHATVDSGSFGPGPSSDSWPVKVTIYDVDFESMTLSASMEAYDVPSNPHSASPTTPTQSSGTSQKPITTYLEGEMIDLKKHTFITENFASTLTRDLTYWRKLPPFKGYPAAELPARLLSREFLAEVNANYILMRWKERCFVSHSPSGPPPHRRVSDGGAVRRGADESMEGCNLTISGFYYVSLRRSDGLIEGLYCDPQSSPYQYLSLNRVKMGAFPSWTFK